MIVLSEFVDLGFLSKPSSFVPQNDLNKPYNLKKSN